MDDTLLAAHICRARRIAADHRFATAAEMLHTTEFWECVAGRQESGLVAVQSDLAWWLAWSGHSHDALRILDRLAAERTTLDTVTVRILSRRAYVTGMASNPQAAARHFRELALQLREAVGVTAQTRLHVARQTARWLGTAGDIDAALSLLLALEQEWAEESDLEPREWLLLQSNIAYFMGQKGDSADTAQCLTRYEELVANRTELLGPRHPDTLDARRNRAWILGRQNPVMALMQLRRLLDDSLAVLERRHRYVMVTRLDLAVMLARCANEDPSFMDRAIVDLGQQVSELHSAVAEAQTAQDVLSEYGRTDLSVEKLDEVHRFLGQVGREEIALDVQRVRDRLESHG